MRYVTPAVLGCLLVFAMAVGLSLLPGEPRLEPLPADQLERTRVVDGTTYHLARDGRAFRVDERSGKWIYHDTVYHPREQAAAYVTEGTTVYRVDPEQPAVRIPVRRQFAESFEGVPEGVAGLRALHGPERGWGSITLQSPAAPTVRDYVKLRQAILAGTGDFVDAWVEPSAVRASDGQQSLRCLAPQPDQGVLPCKASLSCPLVYFREGDDFWFRADFWSEDSRPHTLMDLECEWLAQHAGIRLIIDEQGRLGAELKAWEKPIYRQPVDGAITFPQRQWVTVQAHFRLAEDAREGKILIWQDGRLLVDATGQTLPLASAIYSSLEVGISAHSYGSQPATLFVDNLHVSDQPLAAATPVEQ